MTIQSRDADMRNRELRDQLRSFRVSTTQRHAHRIRTRNAPQIRHGLHMAFQEPQIGFCRQIKNGYAAVCSPNCKIAASETASAAVEAHTLRICIETAIYAFWKVLVCKRVEKLEVHRVGRRGNKRRQFRARATPSWVSSTLAAQPAPQRQKLDSDSRLILILCVWYCQFLAAMDPSYTGRAS